MSIQASDIRAQLMRVLTDESQLLDELEQLLHAESAIVLGNDVEAIQRMGTARHHCVDSLSRLEIERNDICRMLIDGGHDSFISVLERCDPSRALRDSWNKNLSHARRCKAINDRNGAIVIAKLDRVQRLLLTLRGGSTPSVYSPKASRYADFGARDLGCA